MKRHMRAAARVDANLRLAISSCTGVSINTTISNITRVQSLWCNATLCRRVPDQPRQAINQGSVVEELPSGQADQANATHAGA